MLRAIATTELPLPLPQTEPMAGAAGCQPNAVPVYAPLWLCIYLSALALESVYRGPGTDRPCAVLDEAGAQPLIHTASAAAERAGILSGMVLSVAYALCPGLQVRRRDSAAETAHLERLAAWAQRFTPLVSLAPPQALLLEVRGSLRLFGGIHVLQKRLSAELAVLAQDFFIATTPTPQASLLLARNGQTHTIEHNAVLRSVLGKLPVAALPFSAETIKRLTNSGVRYLHDLWRLPRDGLARRFGPQLLDYLDRTLGLRPDPRQPWHPPHCFDAKLELPQPLTATPMLLAAARQLLQKLCVYLREHDAETMGLSLDLHHARLLPSRIRLGLRRGTHDSVHLLNLLEEHLNRTRLPAAVTAFTLSTDAIQPFTATSEDLFVNQRAFTSTEQREEGWQRLTDQLQARLGSTRIHPLRACQDHRPERAWRDTESGILPAGTIGAKRPLWLLANPRRLSPSQRDSLRLKPHLERIESGWWDGLDIRRDYYSATDPHGCGLWIFRDLQADGTWYVHGLFG